MSPPDCSAGLDESGIHVALPELQHVFDTCVDLMCIVDPGRCLSRVSASAGGILDHEPLELVGRDFLDLVHPEDARRTLQAHEAIVAGASIRDFENRCRRKDGSLIDLSWSASWLPQAQVVCWVGRDITNRKRIEVLREQEHARADARLKESLARLELAQSIAQLGYWERDLLSDRMHFYGEANAIIGIPADRQIDLPMLMELVPEEDRHILVDGYTEANRGVAYGTLQFRIRRTDGALRHIYAQRYAIRDDSGSTVKIIGTLQDVTERFETDIERQRYLAQLAFLADAASKVNSVLTAEELLQVITDIARDLVDAHVAVTTVEGNAGGAPAVHRALSEKYVSVEAQELEAVDSLAVSLTTAAGRRIGSMRVADKRSGNFTQNDERVLVQLADLAAVGLENARLYAELEDRVRKRTQELEQSNRELEAFSYSVSHDLRGPLRAIAGFTGLLRDRHYDTIDADSRRYIDRVLAGTERMSNLIDDLLELGRVTRVEIKRELVDLSILARSVVAHIRERAPERAAEIYIEQNQKVYGDLRLMEIALENLFDNAWKFTGGRPIAEIRFGSMLRGRGERTFFVQDNGVGFDLRYAANLFGVFQRLHAASEFPGTGVGLATVQRIVQRHGGRIWAEAEVDRGATFYFTIAGGR